MKGGEFPFSHRKGEDVRRLVHMEIPEIQGLNLNVVDQEEAQVSVRESQLGQYSLGYLSYFS